MNKPIMVVDVDNKALVATLHTVDKLGRICLPATMRRNFGIKTVSQVLVAQHEKGILIMPIKENTENK